MKAKHVKIILGSLGLYLLGGVAAANAASLVQVYRQAQLQDPTFQQAEATWMAARENLPIAQAAYLPQLALTGAAQENYTDNSPVQSQTNTNGSSRSYSYGITLTQPIFNVSSWMAIRSARAQVKAAFATYNAAAQDLMVRTATAYFAVLQAYDQLRFTLANKRAVYRQLETAREKFKVGLIAITGVYDAQSSYDQAIATEITDRNNLYNQIENLRAITGVHYFALRGLQRRVPLIRPQPDNINEWVGIARAQNFQIKAQQYNVISARQTINQQSAGWMPQLNAVGSWTQTSSSNFSKSPNTTARTGFLGVQLNVPLYQGGLVRAETSQARANYAGASAQLESDYRSVVSDTRQSYLGVISGISQIRADAQAIKSAQNALEATKAGYVVGTRTIVDVLDDLTTLTQAQQQFANDQYAYILNIIRLKQAAGTLSFRDLHEINSWLGKNINFHLPASMYGKPKVLQHAGTSLKHVPKPMKTRAGKKHKQQKHKLNKKPKASTHTHQQAAVPTTTPVIAKKSPFPAPRKTHRSERAPVKGSHFAQIARVPNAFPAPTHTRPQFKLAKKSVYTLQLFASKSKEGADKAMAKLPQAMQVGVIKDGKVFKVVSGGYANFTEANNALQQLPKSVQKHYQPWVFMLPKSGR